MKLQELIQEYLRNRKALGWRRCPSDGHLGTFGRFVGMNADLDDVRPEQVEAFLKGKGEITLSWHHKYGALKSFYRWLFDRGYIEHSPLPTIVPRQPPAFVPYIYSIEELRSILQAFDEVCCSSLLLDPITAKTMVLTLYGCGLRRREAINLDGTNIDFEQSTLTIRDTKFLKTRLVPFGVQLGRELKAYSRAKSDNSEEAFFVNRKNRRIDCQILQRYFRRACVRAGVRREDSKRFQPRLHDLRHSFAVHRLTSWYERGDDVQRLLPHLSTYLGHASVRNTQAYLTMTPALLDEANKRFEQYMERGMQ